ncbi:sce7726 family protein [Burkholderia diffusa]|uniref:sce7726 family protein n=1 Tax=Burkholderia diffusa TaxID=488732 RepID=UPI0012472834|nr:sce7726 family protein [Burkholderia diffusa]KAB0654853.1 sce7726 family protein [Burkholderia diffusa]MBM2650938.1 sce7726 family protein [Burkholderia diffusa]
MLDDKAIRQALISMLSARSPRPRLLVQELGVHNTNAIVDVAAIYSELHGFEIKGETDSVSRVSKQSKYYNLSFPRLTLVTTSNHLGWALKNLPDFWGIILAKNSPTGAVMNYIRPTKSNPDFCKETSLLMLWKDELLNLEDQGYEIRARKSDTRAELASKIASKLTKHQIITLLAESIENRHRAKDYQPQMLCE